MSRTSARLFAIAFDLQAEVFEPRLVVAQGTPQGSYEEPPVMKGKSPEEKMNMRFPHPVKVGDLIGLPVLDDYDLTIGYVRRVVRTPQGKIQLIVAVVWLERALGLGPIEVVAILGRQIDSLDMPGREFSPAPTWSEKMTRPLHRLKQYGLRSRALTLSYRDRSCHSPPHDQQRHVECASGARPRIASERTLRNGRAARSRSRRCGAWSPMPSAAVF
jgi:hypothetical protein